MELGSIVQFLENKTILLTGATGFLAKIFLEKILRVQPNVDKFYLLLRAADSKCAAERLNNEIIGKDLFRVLREKHGSNLSSLVAEKITVVAGDISHEDLGVKDCKLRDEMWQNVDTIVNFAATTNFDERYDVALGINTLGALNVLNFAKKCAKINVLAHVSTAYVCGEDVGVIVENQFQIGKPKKGTNTIDIDEEKELVKKKLQELKSAEATEKEITSAMKDFGIQRAQFYGWPNTYVFTKAMGEMVMGHLKDKLPLIIMRPTMITGTYKEPFPGWIEGIKTIDSLIAGYGKGKLTCFISPKTTPDVIPADMVVNAIIVGMVAKATNHNNENVEQIYHLGSSFRNPVKFSQFHDFTFRYFTANPWINKDGKPVQIGRGTVLTTMASFHLYLTIRFLLPLKQRGMYHVPRHCHHFDRKKQPYEALSVVNMILFQKYQDMYTILDRRIKLVMRLVELYKPYIFFEGIFDDTNSEKLRIAARETSPEADAFNFDPKTIDWEDYITSAHIPGLVKYSMK